MIDETLRMSGRFRSIFAGVNAGIGLSTMESTVLAVVVEAPTPPTVPQIGRSLGHPRQVIQRAVNSLVDAGIVETRENPDHKRARMLVPTAKGRAIKGHADAGAGGIADELLKEIEPALCQRVTRDLRTVRGVIEAYLRAKA